MATDLDRRLDHFDPLSQEMDRADPQRDDLTPAQPGRPQQAHQVDPVTRLFGQPVQLLCGQVAMSANRDQLGQVDLRRRVGE